MMYSQIQDDEEVARELFGLIRQDTGDIERGAGGEPNEIWFKDGRKLLAAERFSDMNLSPELLKAIYSRNFENPSIIQKSAIPCILQGSSVAVQSESGTGKTMAYTCGVLGVVKPGVGIQAIILTPTRELNMQVAEFVSGLASSLGIRVLSALKNKAVDGEILEEVVVGCPGTILNLIDSGKLDCKKVILAVLDEADILLDKDSMGAQTFRILKMIPEAQKVFFSATYSQQEKQIIDFYSPDVVKMYKDCNRKPEEIRLFYVEVEGKKKPEYLKSLPNYLTVSQMIVFVNTKAAVDYLKKVLEEDMHSVSCLHGDMEISERERAISEFKGSKTKVLVTTNVLSRGIDILQVNLIVNYDLPSHSGIPLTETYIHRVGRSGRFGRRGFVVDFVGSVKELETYLSFQNKLKFTSKKFTMKALEKVYAEECNK